MSCNIIGREKEISELKYLLDTDKSEFIAIYGRRRVGKSFLIDEVYGSAMAFRTVGIFIKNEELTEESYRQKQLKHFYESLLDYGLPSTTECPTTWLQAFSLLKQLACYCWKGTSASGTGAQIDMVLEWKGERTDYLFEIKYSENIYTIDVDYEQNLRNKTDAFLHSKKHNPVHSVNMVFLTTFGLSQGIHNAPVDTQLTMDVLFKE